MLSNSILHAKCLNTIQSITASKELCVFIFSLVFWTLSLSDVFLQFFSPGFSQEYNKIQMPDSSLNVHLPSMLKFVVVCGQESIRICRNQLKKKMELREWPKMELANESAKIRDSNANSVQITTNN
jgi:ABC-type sulfate transport system permease subunit